MDNMERRALYQQKVQGHKEGQPREKLNTYSNWMDQTREIAAKRRNANKDIMNDHRTSTYYNMNSHQEGDRTLPGR
jgi:hypothetical protein